MEWKRVFYNGIETNIEVTKYGKVRRIRVDWMQRKSKIGEVNFSKLKSHPKGYIRVTIQIKELNPKSLQVQQLIASAFLGYQWNGMKNVVMHLDDNPSNNKLSNLKVDTQRENCSQIRTLKTGLPVGVHFYKRVKKYTSQIYINGKHFHLGYFNTPEEASQAYQNKLKEIL